MEWTAANKAALATVVSKFVDSFELISGILKEKVRVVEATPPVIFHTNEETSLN